MSANDVMFINTDTFEVYYQGCADNDGYGRLIGKYKTLKEAIKASNKWVEKHNGYSPEYGIHFISSTKNYFFKSFDCGWFCDGSNRKWLE